MYIMSKAVTSTSPLCKDKAVSLLIVLEFFQIIRERWCGGKTALGTWAFSYSLSLEFVIWCFFLCVGGIHFEFELLASVSFVMLLCRHWFPKSRPSGSWQQWIAVLTQPLSSFSEGCHFSINFISCN